MDSLLNQIKSGLQPQSTSIQAYAVANEGKLAAGDRSTMEQLAGIVFSGNLFNLVLAMTLGIQSAWLVLIGATGGVAMAAAKALDIVIGLIMGALIGFVVTMAVDALLLGIDGFFKSLIPAGDPFWSEGVGIVVLGGIIALGAYFNARWSGEVLRGTDAWWLAWAILSIPFQLAAPLIPPSVGWLAVLLSGTSLIIDSIAVEKIIFEIHDVFDWIGGPFKYIEELTSTVTLAYDATAFVDDVRSG